MHLMDEGEMPIPSSNDSASSRPSPRNLDASDTGTDLMVIPGRDSSKLDTDPLPASEDIEESNSPPQEQGSNEALGKDDTFVDFFGGIAENFFAPEPDPLGAVDNAHGEKEEKNQAKPSEDDPTGHSDSTSREVIHANIDFIYGVSTDSAFHRALVEDLPKREAVSEELTLINPAYLSQFPKEGTQRKEVFFREVLPVLVTRFDHFGRSGSLMPNDMLSEMRFNCPGSPYAHWIESFAMRSFSASAAALKYEKDQLRHIGALYDFTVYQRARVMYDLLWKNCAEFFSLGLAYWWMQQPGGLGHENMDNLQKSEDRRRILREGTLCTVLERRSFIESQIAQSSSEPLKEAYTDETYRKFLETMKARLEDKINTSKSKGPKVDFGEEAAQHTDATESSDASSTTNVEDKPSVSSNGNDESENEEEVCVPSVDGDDSHDDESPASAPLESKTVFQYPEADLIHMFQRLHMDPYYHAMFETRSERAWTSLASGSPNNGELDRLAQILDLASVRDRPDDPWKGTQVQDRIWEVYSNGPPGTQALVETMGGDYWRMISRNIKKFCQELGIYSSSNDPLEDLEILRGQAMMRDTVTHDLMNRIRELESEKEDRKKTVAALAFRHLTEWLPPPCSDSKSISNPTSRWKDFWNVVWTKAKEDPTHPLRELYERFNKYRQADAVKRQGKELYSTLSSWIHNESKGYDSLVYSHWSPEESALMRFLVPQTEPLKEGGVDWWKERERFGYTTAHRDARDARPAKGLKPNNCSLVPGETSSETPENIAS